MKQVSQNALLGDKHVPFIPWECYLVHTQYTLMGGIILRWVWDDCNITKKYYDLLASHIIWVHSPNSSRGETVLCGWPFHHAELLADRKVPYVHRGSLHWTKGLGRPPGDAKVQHHMPFPWSDAYYNVVYSADFFFLKKIAIATWINKSDQ